MAQPQECIAITDSPASARPGAPLQPDPAAEEAEAVEGLVVVAVVVADIDRRQLWQE
jgi:hypothetical protein